VVKSSGIRSAALFVLKIRSRELACKVLTPTYVPYRDIFPVANYNVEEIPDVYL
jgi:hypothetical protein